MPDADRGDVDDRASIDRNFKEDKPYLMITQTIRLFLPFEAAAFVAAASVHFGLIIAGYEHQKAGAAESVIAAVLIIGVALTSLGPTWTRRVGLAAQVFALLGTLIGVFTIAIGVGPRTMPDVAYHFAIVAVLIGGLVVAVRAPADDATSHT
jgi:hypothetical protein